MCLAHPSHALYTSCWADLTPQSSRNYTSCSVTFFCNFGKFSPLTRHHQTLHTAQLGSKNVGVGAQERLLQAVLPLQSPVLATHTSFVHKVRAGGKSPWGSTRGAAVRFPLSPLKGQWAALWRERRDSGLCFQHSSSRYCARELGNSTLSPLSYRL